ncbi:hypothetical protein H5410_035788, partial [Solanum commersonii]
MNSMNHYKKNLFKIFEGDCEGRRISDITIMELPNVIMLWNNLLTSDPLFSKIRLINLIPKFHICPMALNMSLIVLCN